MKRNKSSIFILSVIALLGLSSCSAQEIKSWVKTNLYHPAKALVEKLMGKEQQKEEEKKDEQTPTPTPSGEDQPSGGGEGGGGEEDTRPEYEKGDKKAEEGTGLMFSETVGFNTKDATVFAEDENTRYIIYASNETAKGAQVFAARKAEKQEGAWKYGEKHIIFRGATGENAWDKAIFQPSVIKGEFHLGEATYTYLMAYQGNEDGSNYNNHIGLAVSNDVLGEWTRVGNAPILANPELYEASFGFGSPELVSYNEHGQAFLFYSFGETQLSGERVKTADFSDLEHIQLEAGYAELPTAGLLGRDDGIISNAGFAISQDNKLLIANDGMPSSNAPGCANSFEVAKASLDIIQSAGEHWTSVEKFGSLDSMDEEKLGWDELYSPTFVRDAFGKVNTTAGKLEVVYSTFDEDAGENARFTGQLALHEVTLE